MRLSRLWLIALPLALGAGLALLVGAAPGPAQAPHEQQAGNRQVLEQWKRDPDHYRRLLDDLETFKALPAPRQERVRKLDSDLRTLAPAERQALWSVMERYARWLKALPEGKRRKIEEAATEQEKLELVRKFRDDEWYNKLPRSSREELEAIKDPAIRDERKLQLRALERLRRREWISDPTGRPQQPRKERPARLSEFPGEVQYYYEKCLKPLLTAHEREEVQQAGEKPWPALARLLLAKADRYPLSLPGPAGPVRVSDLPPPHAEALSKPALYKKLRLAEGKWPEFGVAVQELGTRVRMGVLPPDTMPTSLEVLPSAVRDFVLDEFTPTEKEELTKMRGKWPEYPRTIVKFAEQHKKPVPLMKLPGPPELWEKARTEE